MVTDPDQEVENAANATLPESQQNFQESQDKGGAYAFLDQNDEEVEIKIEPIQNYLKFTSLDAVNQSDYQTAI